MSESHRMAHELRHTGHHELAHIQEMHREARDRGHHHSRAHEEGHSHPRADEAHDHWSSHNRGE
jgi:hypothetical protein